MTSGQTMNSSLAHPAPGRAPVRAQARQRARKERIVAVAMQHFAERGYDGVRIEEIAREAGVAKGAVFGYFTSKAGLFLAAYQAAARSFSSYLEAPPEVREQGFFAVITYWLVRTPHLIREDWVPYRVTLLGNYCSSLQLRREITQFLLREDPYGTQAFVQFGADRGEIRRDIDMRMVVSLVVQVYGGRGWSTLYRPGRHWQDVRVCRIYEGTDEVLKLKIAAAVLGKEYEAFK